MRLLAVVFLLHCAIIRLASSSNTVKCYCTDDHCVPYGACDGIVCLVGILRDSNQVIRTCGTRPLGCYSERRRITLRDT
uniref:Secreted protein n=1 Tax=Angiostrongylus cantonensis TaxID=6313 RepID=A0A0K0D116_ANGCA